MARVAVARVAVARVAAGRTAGWIAAVLLTMACGVPLAACGTPPVGGRQGDIGLPLTAGAGRTSVPRVSVPAVMPTGHQRFLTLPGTSGRTLETTLTGARSGVTLRVWIWLPEQYDQPAFAHTAFPALMMYPGGSGAGHNAWVGPALAAQKLITEGARTGRLTPFLLVMPEMQVSADLDTECADLPGQPRVGTFLADDVRQLVLDNFRVLRDRVGWGAAGASSGAYCATRLVFDHPDQYTAAASLDGYFTIETPLAGGSDPAVRAGDPAAVAASAPPDVSVLLWSGSGAGADLTDARHFLAEIRSPTTAELRLLPGGRHLTVDLARMVPDTLAFLTARLARPTALRTSGPG